MNTLCKLESLWEVETLRELGTRGGMAIQDLNFTSTSSTMNTLLLVQNASSSTVFP